jgi:dsDNA-specific endonuclease/ATPase MutS2
VRPVALSSITPLPLQDKKALQQQLRAGWSPRPGDSVFVPRINKRAKVVSVDGAGLLTLQAGLLKITATPEEVRRQQ